MRFRDMDDLREGRAVFQDYTNRMLIEMGEEAPERSAEEAGAILARLAREHRFTLYEYFITDKLGHLQDMERARVVLSGLARLIRTLLSNLDLGKMTVMLTSDHGNIEDLSSRNHTLNDVPTIIWGSGRALLSTRIRSLADITPAILETLGEEPAPNR